MSSPWQLPRMNIRHLSTLTEAQVSSFLGVGDNCLCRLEEEQAVSCMGIIPLYSAAGLSAFLSFRHDYSVDEFAYSIVLMSIFFQLVKLTM